MAEQPLKKKYKGKRCSAIACKSYQGDPDIHFFRFPARNLESRDLWIKALKICHEDGSEWRPSNQAVLCSKHFVLGKPSLSRTDPDYVPSIFLTNHVRAKNLTAAKRRERAKKRILQEFLKRDVEFVSVECQTNPIECGSQFMFSCEFYDSGTATQADIPRLRSIGSSMTPRVIPAKTSTSTMSDPLLVPKFADILKDEKKFGTVIGVPISFFNLLMILLTDVKDGTGLMRKEKILLYLVKLKHNNPFYLLGFMFKMHPITASRAFKEVLLSHYDVSRKWVFWISRQQVNATMPKSFRERYPQTRVIIDASEVRCEKPKNITAQVLMYSAYKSSFTMKYLIGIAPSGLITYVSRAYGGRVTDAHLTTDSGFLKLIQQGDTVMADKGFPKITSHANDIGAFVVMPPFRTGGKQFSKEENEECYQVASLRIHVERSINRMKWFRILKSLENSLFPHIDQILLCIAHICNHLPHLIREDMNEIDD